MERIAEGIWKMTFGTPEQHTPVTYRSCEANLEQIDRLPVSKRNTDVWENIEWRKTARGVHLRLSMQTDEDIYGFGLQLQSVNQVGLRRYIKVNSDPVANTGESHAPVPFYISTSGYGLLVDTFRYASFLMGTNTCKGDSRHMTVENQTHEEFSESALYALKKAKEIRKVLVDIPHVQGVDVYVFEGNVQEIVQRYNLFSGGGCIPPMWGLGIWYRAYGGCDQNGIIRLCKQMRQDGIPLDVMGLEPGWHSHSYACTYRFSYLFPEPDRMLAEAEAENLKLNLWEHIYVYPTADIYKDILPYCGDYEVWNGVVPDFATKEARTIFADYHRANFVQKGIAGFKLDECDNSDYNPSNWGFPDISTFPSGMDGEQMHSAVGVLYQHLIHGIYQGEGKRTYSQVRSSGALATPLPFVLYSDLYDHKQFIKGVVSSGFSGLLWCPEVRDCRNGDDLLRRLQTVIFSAHALVNSWRIPNPPWKQTNIEKNLKGEIMDTSDYYTAEVRKLFCLRMSLLPYLYSAFHVYARTGKPPIRALVQDFPEDIQVKQIEDAWMFGDSICVYPLTYEDGNSRKIYLPDGTWFDFFSKQKIEGGKWFVRTVPYTEIPVFVKAGSLIPIAEPIMNVQEDSVFQITLEQYGDGIAEFVLYEDDMVSANSTAVPIPLVCRDGKIVTENSTHYVIVKAIQYK